jgi:hypothetical protein
MYVEARPIYDLNPFADGVMVARENPAIGIGLAVSTALLVMRGIFPSFAQTSNEFSYIIPLKSFSSNVQLTTFSSLTLYCQKVLHCGQIG